MLICDKCGSEIPDGSRFCPQCADPVTVADTASPPQVQALRLVCPKCEAQESYRLDLSNLAHRPNCSNCNRDFVTRVVQIRAKRSRGNKKEGKRRFSIRVVDASGAEDLIEFVNADYHDFELRSKDLAVFSYHGNELKLVQNLTIGRYWKVSKPACYVATYLYGPTASQTRILREFRDQVLLDSRFLSGGVRLYYYLSPIVIRRCASNRVFEQFSRKVTGAAAKIAERYLESQDASAPASRMRCGRDSES